MNNKIEGFILFCVVVLICGCAAKLPEKSTIDASYSVNNVKTYHISTDCSKTVVSGLQGNFAENYCPILESNMKLSLQKQKPGWSYTTNNPDLNIMATLEQIQGGSAAARFWIGFGAGRSVTTVSVQILKGETVIAERRFNETTTMPNIAAKNWSNEDAIIQDAPLVAKKIADFVQDPVAYAKENPE